MNMLVPVTKDVCPVCGAMNPASAIYSDSVEFRGLELDVEGLQESKCRDCGHIWVTKEQRSHNNSVKRDAYVIVRDELRAKEGLLTGQEISQIREMFGINQREAAVIFGGGFNAFNKYESGEVLQSFAMDRLLRLSGAVGFPAIEFLKNVFSPPNFVVISTNRPNEMRITFGATGLGYFTQSMIHGASFLSKFDTAIEGEVLPSKLPVVQEHYQYLVR